MEQTKLLIAYRSSDGLGFIYGPPEKGPYSEFERDLSSLCRDMSFSENGSLFAWCNGNKVIILSTASFKHIQEIDKPRTTSLKFSPKGTYLCTWEPYVAKETPQDSHNLFIWIAQTGECVKSFIQKKQTNWCPQWSDDEYLCVRNVSNEVHFFEAEKFDAIAKKIFVQKVTAFSLSPGPPSYHVACYVPGVKGQPSFVRLFKYPNFEGTNAVIAQKSFFKADRTEFFWNKKGSDLIVQSFSDVDKTDSSYYGEQNLYYFSTKGEPAKVKLGKDGPIYALAWSPNSTEFCVVYGYMPANATIYNLKCEAIFNFGPGHRNEVHYTQTGNRLILCGFGNLRGNIEVWDMKEHKLITNFTAMDSTCLSWSPDGEFILTATTAPRLRIGNGYRMWHYTAVLLQEVFIDSTQELWEMKWLPVPQDKLKFVKSHDVPLVSIQSAVPQASKQVYRPPGARGQPSAFKLHDDIPGNVAQKIAEQSKSKKKKSKKPKKEPGKEEPEEINDVQENKETNAQENKETNAISNFDLTGDPEKDKKIRGILKKLDQIEKLKKEKESGKKLEKNQEDKIKKEQELTEELASLQL